MQPNLPVDIAAGLEKIAEASRVLSSLLNNGDASIFSSSRGDFEPFRVWRMDMLNNLTINKPFKVGPHKSILYRGIVTGDAGNETPQAYTSNDVAYYKAGRRDSDASNWIVLQAGKSMEFDFPVNEGWLYIPNPDRNPTFAVFETSVVGYIRSYTQNSGASITSIQDGSLIDPNAAVAVSTTAVQVVPAGANPRTVTMYNAGPDTAWIGGALGGGAGPFIAQVNWGVPIASGEKVVIKNTSEISAICDTAKSASISYTVEE
ncbi:MAG: hypothetical protein AB7K68_17580 [Bacteriovoracia bacterium]